MDKKQEVKLKIDDNHLRGVYANQIAIMHSKYEFLIDFVSMFPPEPIVNARVITTPSALKRMYNAIGINLKKYEENYGEIEDDTEIETPGTIN